MTASKFAAVVFTIFTTLLFAGEAKAASAYYTPTASIVTLQALGQASPTVVHAYVQSTSDNYTWSPNSTATASTTAPLQVVAATGVSTGRWIREAKSYGIIGPGVTPNAGPVVVAPYTDVFPVVSGSGNFGPVSGETSFDMLNVGHQLAVRQNGCVSRVRVYTFALTGMTGFYVKFWRPDAQNPNFQFPGKTTYSFLAQSSNLIGSLANATINTLAISPCIQVHEGDFVGIHIDYSSASAQPLVTTAAPSTTSGDISAIVYYVTNATPTSPHYDWSAQLHVSSVAIPVEAGVNAAPILVTFGNSETSGYGVKNTSFVDIQNNNTNMGGTLAHILGAPFGYTYQNVGIGGQTCAQLAARVATDVVALHPKYAINECGINDIAANVPNSTIIANLTTILNAELADGEIPVVLGVFPFYPTATSGQMTQRDLLNPLLQALVTGAPYNGYYISPDVLGVYNSNGPAGNLWSLAPWFDDGDGLHVNGAGLGALQSQILSGGQSSITALTVSGSNVGVGFGAQIPPAPLSIGNVVSNPNFNMFEFGSNVAQTFTTRTRVGNLGQSNDPTNAWVLSLNMLGNTTAGSREFDLQTGQDGSTTAGVLALQPLGGTVSLGATTFSSTVALGTAASATGTFNGSAGAFTGLLTSGGLGTCPNNIGARLIVCEDHTSTDTTVRPAFSAQTNDTVNGFGLFVSIKGGATLADRLVFYSTGMAGLSNGGNMCIQCNTPQAVAIGGMLGATPNNVIEMGGATTFDSTITVAGGLGVTCAPGLPSASFATSNGVVIHC